MFQISGFIQIMKVGIRYCIKPSWLAPFALAAIFGCKELEKLIQDNQAPVIDRITALRTSLSPSDTTTIKVEAHDPEGGALAYSWSAAGGTLSATSGSSVRWTAPALAGNHTISVKVRDEGDAETEGAVTLSVIALERPTVEITQPVEGAFIPGLDEVLIQAQASHPNGIARVEFYAKEVFLGQDNSPPYQLPWRVEGLSGPATIIAKAFRPQASAEPGVDSVRVSIEGVTRW